ncbi:ferredoxin-thioredoxin reductase catalytic domain-containing protein [Methanofollis fontis]|uniref:ferredoxin:thioredoxin reductase n=1 Tax=Methanofollis fontis TaxID=2052832 RepID=A0A483CPH9_9EURY|nr:ferredoxin-thioredoxin reductase catalytic domain-containing protein [Methanofollis fontis]TAJ44008.1 ferredoxin:glutaredoxin reductase [Methanofollis fontis]
MPEITDDLIETEQKRLEAETEAGGYHLNPDREFVATLVRGLLENEGRYGYRACPCRLASGDRERDLDIICPCDYRDPDLTEHGACYCALYVSGAVVAGERTVRPVPERRPPGGPERREISSSGIGALPLPVWRCRVCGYLCAREQPPEVCPVCRAAKDRFERFI